MINLKKGDKKEEIGEVQMKEIIRQEDESRDGESEGGEEQQKKQPINDYKDSYEMSKMALEKCKQIHPAHKDFVKSGTGKFVSNPFTSIRETYKAVFDMPEPRKVT